jgi:hypothetical protein
MRALLATVVCIVTIAVTVNALTADIVDLGVIAGTDESRALGNLFSSYYLNGDSNCRML